MKVLSRIVALLIVISCSEIKIETFLSKFQDTGMEVLGSRVRLLGHKDCITCMELCQAFSIVVSGSCDKTAIIWDLNR